ncbi:MAG: hypothetical protein ABFS86_06790 [Planctomycetota bacterium]
MSWIDRIAPEDAEGPLARVCDEALKRAGRIYEIVKIQSLRPDILQAWLAHVVAFFNDANRLAESLSVDPEPA